MTGQQQGLSAEEREALQAVCYLTPNEEREYEWATFLSDAEPIIERILAARLADLTAERDALAGKVAVVEAALNQAEQRSHPRDPSSPRIWTSEVRAALGSTDAAGSDS